MTNDLPICEDCGTTTAMIFHIVNGSTGTIRNVCENCIAAAGPASRAWLDEMRDPSCIYCGAPACSGGIDHFQMMEYGQEPHMRWMCGSCSTEHGLFMLQALKAPPGWPMPRGAGQLTGHDSSQEFKSTMEQFMDGIESGMNIMSREEQIEHMKKIHADAEAHMKRFVARRDN